MTIGESSTQQHSGSLDQMQNGGDRTEPRAEVVPRYSKIGETATELRVSVASLRRWSKEGRIPSGRTPGGQRLFSIDELKNIIWSNDEE
jgi:hypothetical protein